MDQQIDWSREWGGRLRCGKFIMKQGAGAPHLSSAGGRSPGLGLVVAAAAQQGNVEHEHQQEEDTAADEDADHGPVAEA